MVKGGIELNQLGLSVESLLVILIVLVVIQLIISMAMGGSSDGFTSNVDYDKYLAAYNQEQDNVLGATPAGDALNKKVVSAWEGKETLLGAQEAPAFWDGRDYNMEQSKGEGGVITTSRPIDSVETYTEGNNADDVLTKILHGN